MDPGALERRTRRFVVWHVQKKEVDDDPEKDDLDEIKNVNGIEAANFEVGLEKRASSSPGQNQKTEIMSATSATDCRG